MTAAPTPFRLQVGDDVLADLKSRLAHVRWPDEVPDNHWKYGTELAYLKSLVEYWRDRYDWRKHEAGINRFNQYKVRLAGIDVHYIREEGKGPKPMPLLISHGWPGSVHEFHKILPMLTDPGRFGGEAADAFTSSRHRFRGTPSLCTESAALRGRKDLRRICGVMGDVLGSTALLRRGRLGAFVTSPSARLPRTLAGITSSVSLSAIPVAERPTGTRNLLQQRDTG